MRVCHHQKGGICWDIDPSILILDVLVMINTIAFDDFDVSLSNSEKDQCKEQQSCSGDHGSKGEEQRSARNIVSVMFKDQRA